jgi:hypothetical protein
LFDLGGFGARVLDVAFVLCGLAIMVQFVRAAHRIEPFTTRGWTRVVDRQRKKLIVATNYSLACVTKITYFRSAQFRTCLWPCVGR